MHGLIFTKDALKQLEGIPKKDLVRIMKKLSRFCEQEQPLVFAKKLVNPDIGTRRWRV
jgi:mRNA-degrading endonuclease RelE of RelBE toxin-antitoxin system